MASRTPATLWAPRLSMIRRRPVRPWRRGLLDIGRQLRRGAPAQSNRVPFLTEHLKCSSSRARDTAATGWLRRSRPGSWPCGRGPGLGDEYQALGAQRRLALPPRGARRGAVRALLLGGVPGLFFRVSPWFWRPTESRSASSAGRGRRDSTVALGNSVRRAQPGTPTCPMRSLQPPSLRPAACDTRIRFTAS